MNPEEAKSVLQRLGSSKFRSSSKGFMAQCPLSFQHKNGVDNNPSMQVFCDKDPTICFCFSCKFSGNLWKLAKACGASPDLLDYIDGAEGRDIYKRAAHLPDYDHLPNVLRNVDRAAIARDKQLLARVFDGGGWYFHGSSSRQEAQNVSDEEKNKVLRWLSAPYPAYLAERGILQSTAKTWDIGYDGSGVVGLRKAKNAHGINYEYFFSIGERVVFVVRNAKGEIVGWSKRSVHKEPSKKCYKGAWQGKDLFVVRGEPRYYHMPGWKKELVMYGANHVDTSKSKTCVVVEGFMDVLNLFQHNIPNPLACMGGDVSDTQLRYLIDNFSSVVLLPDGDVAGLKLADKAFERLKPYMSVKIAGWIDGKDPGDYSGEELRRLLAERHKIHKRN